MSGLVCAWARYSAPGQITPGVIRDAKNAFAESAQELLADDMRLSIAESVAAEKETTKAGPLIDCRAIGASPAQLAQAINKQEMA